MLGVGHTLGISPLTLRDKLETPVLPAKLNHVIGLRFCRC